jgi:hypothetical protein
LQGLFADRKERGTAPRSFCTHDMHAPLAANVGATSARNEVEVVDLFAVLFDQAADVDDALIAGVGMFLAFGGWVRVGCARLIHVNLLSRLAGSRGAATPAGPFTS